MKEKGDAVPVAVAERSVSRRGFSGQAGTGVLFLSCAYVREGMGTGALQDKAVGLFFNFGEGKEEEEPGARQMTLRDKTRTRRPVGLSPDGGDRRGVLLGL
jgi:hypothetical protein